MREHIETSMPTTQSSHSQHPLQTPLRVQPQPGPQGGHARTALPGCGCRGVEAFLVEANLLKPLYCTCCWPSGWSMSGCPCRKCRWVRKHDACSRQPVFSQGRAFCRLGLQASPRYLLNTNACIFKVEYPPSKARRLCQSCTRTKRFRPRLPPSVTPPISTRAKAALRSMKCTILPRGPGAHRTTVHIHTHAWPCPSCMQHLCLPCCQDIHPAVTCHRGHRLL